MGHPWPSAANPASCRVTITAEQPHNGWLTLQIDIIDATGNPQVFRQPVRVI
ncbi:hypothetical protein [Pseudomonas azotoformans]